MTMKSKSQLKFVKTAQESVKTGHVYLNIYSDKADGEVGIIASMFKEMADAFSQIEGKYRAELGLSDVTDAYRFMSPKAAQHTSRAVF